MCLWIELHASSPWILFCLLSIKGERSISVWLAVTSFMHILLQKPPDCKITKFLPHTPANSQKLSSRESLWSWAQLPNCPELLYCRTVEWRQTHWRNRFAMPNSFYLCQMWSWVFWTVAWMHKLGLKRIQCFASSWNVLHSRRFDILWFFSWYFLLLTLLRLLQQIWAVLTCFLMPRGKPI